MYLCVLRGPQNKQRLFLYTALTYRLFETKAESVYCAVRNGSFKSDRHSFVLKGLNSTFIIPITNNTEGCAGFSEKQRKKRTF